MKLDCTCFRLTFGFGLLPILVFAWRVAPLTCGGGGGGGDRTRLRPWGDGGRRWSGRRCYRNIRKWTQAGCRRTQGHGTRRWCQREKRRRGSIRLTCL